MAKRQFPRGAMLVAGLLFFLGGMGLSHAEELAFEEVDSVETMEGPTNLQAKLIVELVTYFSQPEYQYLGPPTVALSPPIFLGTYRYDPCGGDGCESFASLYCAEGGQIDFATTAYHRSVAEKERIAIRGIKDWTSEFRRACLLLPIPGTRPFDPASLRSPDNPLLAYDEGEARITITRGAFLDLEEEAIPAPMQFLHLIARKVSREKYGAARVAKSLEGEAVQALYHNCRTRLLPDTGGSDLGEPRLNWSQLMVLGNKMQVLMFQDDIFINEDGGFLEPWVKKCAADRSRDGYGSAQASVRFAIIPIEFARKVITDSSFLQSAFPTVDAYGRISSCEAFIRFVNLQDPPTVEACRTF